MNRQAPSLRQLQIICFAILMGPTLFAVVIPIVHGMGDGSSFGPELPEGIDTIAAIASTALIPLAFFVRRTIWSKARDGDERTRLFAMTQGTILFMALLEGGMLLDLVLWLVTSKAVPAVIAAGFLWLIALVNFPREHQLDGIGRT